MTITVERERLAKARVLIVGDAMLDRYWFGAVERISPEAPVPVVRVNREEERLGGAANVALNVKTLSTRATLLTVVGTDEPARRLRQLLEREGVSTVLGEDPQLYTIVKLRVIGRSQQLIRVDFENQPDHEVLAGMLTDYERALGDHDAVLFSDYGKGGLTHITRMIELARAQGKIVLVDPKGDDYSRYVGATIVTPNRKELQDVVGRWKSDDQLAEKALSLRKRLGLQALLVTLGKDGMTLFEERRVHHEPARAREVFDVSGAGDTVIATLGAMLGAGAPLHDAVVAANQAAGIVVGKLGTAVVHPEELMAELAQGR